MSPSYTTPTRPGCYEQKQKTQSQSQSSNGSQQQGDSAAAKPITYHRITAAELDAATYALEYLIDGLLVKGQPQIVAGGKKCLKTNLLCDASVSLATGTSFLGKFRVSRTVRTAFMSGESGLHTLQETCRRICRARGMSLSEVDGLIFSPDLPKIDDVRHQAALEEFVQADQIEVLFLDPAYLCMPGGDAGNLFVQGEMLRSLSAICEANGVTLLLCHHTRKGGIDAPFEPPELEHIAWAGFQEFARGWWLLGRREKYEPGTGRHRLWLSVGGSAGHSSLWGLDIDEGVYEPGRDRVWGVEVLTAPEARDSAQQQVANGKRAKTQSQLNQDVAALLDAAGRHPEGETKNALRDAAGLSGTRANLAIASALKSGKLVACEVVKPGRKTPHDAFKLPPKPDLSDLSD
ncbi:MAG: AAA family ATPase [Pirellulaceae bacterium]